MTLQPYKPVC